MAADGGDTGLRAVLRIVRGHRGWIALAVALTLAASTLGMVQPLLVRGMIDSAGMHGFRLSVIAALIAVFVGQSIALAGGRYLLARTGESVVLGVRLNLIHHLLRLCIPAYDRNRTGDLIARASADTTMLRRLIAEGLADTVTGVIGLVGTVALMIWLDWELFLLVAIMTATGASLAAFAVRGIREISLRSQRSTGEMASDLERALSAIRTVRASGAERRETRRIAERATDVYRASVRLAKLDATVGPAGGLAINGSFLVVLLVGGMRVANGTSSIGDLIAFLLYLTYLAGPIDSLLQAFSTVRQGAGALQRIDEALRLPRETAEPSTAASTGSAADGPCAGGPAPALEFRDVWFSYTPGQPVLSGVSFVVPARGHVALVGRSGSGKSTIFALAERFYEPDHGRILSHGTDVRLLDRREHRRGIGLVEQHCPLLYGTLRENLTYAAPHAAPKEIRKVVEQAGLDSLVRRMPRGLDSEVGEHGVRLSGGERQRVAIARSLLTRPGLLLLDEPTSQLDAENEAALRRAIEQISGECALLVIAHRFSTVRAAGRVVVLDMGSVVADGTHDALVETSAYYRGLAAWRAG